MAYKTVKFGDHRERRSFSTKYSTLELSNLLEVQKDSFDLFLKEGIKEVFEDIFPVESFSGSLSLEFGDYYFDAPKYTVKESRERKVTYAAPLKVKARLFINETGEVKEQEVFLGDMPLMTDTASFIINGAERVINSQLVMGPSCYYKNEVDNTGRNIITSEVRPNKGTWLEYELDARGILYVRIDRTRKVPVTTLLRALGLSSDEEILEVFGQDEYLINTLEKDSTKNTDEALIEIYEKLRPGEPATLDSAKNQLIVRFFDKFRYDLCKVGRYKFNKKLNVIDRLLNVTIAQDIKVGKEVLVKKGTLITKDILQTLKPVFADGYGVKEVKINEELDTYNKIQEVLVYANDDSKKVIKVIGNDQSIDTRRLTISDVYASLSYYICLLYGVGKFDEIDHLGNRRVRQVGELIQNQFRIGVARMERQIRDKMSTQEIDTVTPKSLINIRPVTAALKEFFGSSQLSKFMDQINPLAELNDKRRLSALGPGGLSRDRAGFEVRDVNPSHYGRICPIETPEGQNIGLITSLSSYARINEYGFIMTPYRKVVDSRITDEIVYMTADEEEDYYISQATINADKKGNILDETVPVRFNGDNLIVPREKVDYIDVSPSQIVSVTTSMIPFMEHDDANRTLMGANMQRQAVPLMITEAPIVGTGVEAAIARDSGCSVVSDIDGVVEYVDAKKIIVKGATEKHTYELISYQRSNAETCYNQRPIVKKGEEVHKGEIIADGPSTDKGEIALGKNLVVAFMTYNGYNYEDAVILNERVVRDDVLTSVHIEMKEIECRDTKLGPEEFTRDIPNISEEARKNLDENGIVRIGTEVKENDILVGKVTPKGMQELSSEEKLLHAIFGEKTREVRDTSLRVSHGCSGIVHDVQIFTKENSDELQPGVSKIVRVYIVKKRKIQVGDKMAGRHGNKGVCSLILPSEDMPYLPDGTPVDIILNPLGVPSRMNLGQILELHLGMAGKKLGVHYATPIFNSATEEDVQQQTKEAGLDPDYKTWLYDGRTGEKFDKRVSVGVMYMIRLVHMVDDKIHARATGPYSLVTQQPLGGKAQFGGQRFGEMEVWALYAYGAAHILQEVLTVKSDDVVGRVRVYEALVKGKTVPSAGVPESFRVLIKEFQALGLDIQIINKNGELKDVKELEREEDKDDTPVTIDEITKPEEEEVDESEYEDVQPEDDEDEEFDDLEPGDDDFDYEEEYGLDDNFEDDYERGEE
ncbi:MAG: DNA-directed RNA polymerase subunit beta [Bacilli bacterium]|nr:DNA-directed RNA polymerase subunit beta [Bacilli bacterium]